MEELGLDREMKPLMFIGVERLYVGDSSVVIQGACERICGLLNLLRIVSATYT